jgi:hypothetical protein
MAFSSSSISSIRAVFWERWGECVEKKDSRCWARVVVALGFVYLDERLFVDRRLSLAEPLAFGDKGDDDSSVEDEFPQPKMEASGEVAPGDLGSGLLSFGDPSMAADWGESSMYVCGPSPI